MTNLTLGSEILPSNEQRTPSLYPNQLSVRQTEHNTILKLLADSLFLKLS